MRSGATRMSVPKNITFRLAATILKYFLGIAENATVHKVNFYYTLAIF